MQKNLRQLTTRTRTLAEDTLRTLRCGHKKIQLSQQLKGNKPVFASWALEQLATKEN